MRQYDVNARPPGGKVQKHVLQIHENLSLQQITCTSNSVRNRNEVFAVKEICAIFENVGNGKMGRVQGSSVNKNVPFSLTNPHLPIFVAS